ncbi:MAG: hypothetical protein ACE5OY_01575 [Candidatus Bathyarchaeia archaeon]
MKRIEDYTRWPTPSPAAPHLPPIPSLQADDFLKLLVEIRNRLEAIEKRLAEIEKRLAEVSKRP